MSFLTVEDINSILYTNQRGYWHSINTSLISSSVDYTDIKYDFVRVSRETVSNGYKYTFKIDTNNWYGGYYGLKTNGSYYDIFTSDLTNFDRLVFTLSEPSFILMLYLGNLKNNIVYPMNYYLTKDVYNLNYKQLNTNQVITAKNVSGGTASKSMRLNVGLNDTKGNSSIGWGYVWVNLLKTDFQFNCNQSLTIGKVNKIALGTDADYKPNGDLVGEYTPTITVQYGDETLPVTWDSTLNDYVFDLDLTDKSETGKIRFKVNVKDNEVLNSTSSDVVLESQYETINTLSKLQTLFNNGGTGRLGSNITLTGDMTLKNSVYIIGNDKTIDLSNNQIIVSDEKTFKAIDTTFTNGVNALHQKTDSKVELTDCTFTDCTGLGSCIECDIELHSLDNPTDFTTILTNCTFNNSETCLLHGGELTVTGCTVDGKIANKNYPYFLYQTDGEATLLQNTFNISNDTALDYDLMFNPCIFICGDSAQINGLSHTELQNNGLTSFTENPQNNRSTISLQYYYDLIEDNITLEATNGYCHAVSNVDYVFKANTTVARS